MAMSTREKAWVKQSVASATAKLLPLTFLLQSYSRMWRKNMRFLNEVRQEDEDNDAERIRHCVGVDLNRNFDFFFGSKSDFQG